jgi:hypothetical protein
VEALAPRVGLGPAHAVDDTGNSLPPQYQVGALTAVLVKTDATRLHVLQRGHWLQIRDEVRALIPASPTSMVPAAGKSATPKASSSPAA